MAQPINNQGKNQDSKTVYQQAIAPYASGGSQALVSRVNQTYTPTNDATDRAFDATTATAGELANVLATLIRDLAASGIIRVA